MNNLPYRYPALPDLPSRRVTKSRPFQHVGIDYFGPIAIESGKDKSKAYGIIITCTVTRLIHLQCVPDMSTVQLLDALRRFLARRGVPETITYDNAPQAWRSGPPRSSFSIGTNLNVVSNDGDQRDHLADDNLLRSVSGSVL
nr:Integrase domain containing protein [Haemonchus contortus]